jgi:putative endonuclease
MGFYCYILKSLSHNTFYYGSTADPEKRLKEHNSGKVRYTKGRRPWIVHHLEKFETRSEAFQREHYYKTIEGRRYLKDNNLI